MQLTDDRHLAYCTNIHRGESWPETFAALQQHTLAVRDRICPDAPYAIGLRLGATAAHQLADAASLAGFQRWLDENQCYVFTINGFPYGSFHGTRVKEQVYRPDWTTRERLDYTKLLFDLLVALLPSGLPGSVSTLPGSYKSFISDPGQVASMHRHLAELATHLEDLSERSGHDLHLGLEPEPLGLFENSRETVNFLMPLFEQPAVNAGVLRRRLGVNYDTCHFAVEYESARAAFAHFRQHDVRISKIHLSSALRVTDFAPATLETLAGFHETTYLHQVVARASDGTLTRYNDLDDALRARANDDDHAAEWRIHFHIPLYSVPRPPLHPTTDHLLETLDVVSADPTLCQHYEMETYTWEVLPGDLSQASVVDQLVKEYQWTLDALARRGIGRI